MALDAQDDAEAAEATAMAMSAAAIEAAMTELHIDGTIKTVGESSVDADAEARAVRRTRHRRSVHRSCRRNVGRARLPRRSGRGVRSYYRSEQRSGVCASRRRPAGPIIGKTLDTTDDAARLAVIHSRVGSEKVSVYVRDDSSDATALDFVIRTDSKGKETQKLASAAAGVAFAAIGLHTLKPLGMYYEAADVRPTLPAGATTPTIYARDTVEGSETFGDLILADANDTLAGEDANPGDYVDNLDHDDLVEASTKGKDVYSYVQPADTSNNTVTAMTRYVIETSSTVNAVTGDTDVTYRHVDVTALAAPDIGRDATIAGAHEEVQVKAVLPVAKAYSHIHFGVWAALDEATLAGQKIAGLGIGFVQNFSGSGITDRLGIGTVTYKGDWVAVIQRKNSAAEGAFSMKSDAATMTADFDMEEFEADLKGLAMLEGTLDGNGFSGMKATQISHADLDGSGDFEGEFSGNIYGDKGEEAAGVFDFSGGEAGSFRGAFGGTNQD